MIGQRLGPFEVLAKLGEGGMGEVYRARDTTLNRDVAIKILPPGVASDSGRLARFRREAEVLASLNHPNIAHIYGVESSSTGPALIMEFVAGKTLDELIGDRAMSWDDALPLARQIAGALEGAHERGIVHRDLKPANIKITDAGVVKVLDFGLAKAVAPDAGTTSGAANSPTITARATQSGVILGSPAYMAPEQAKGRPVDRRADIWAFGAVLFEMLSGRRAFAGDDATEVMASVIKNEPNWQTLPANTPPAARRLLRRCLEKDPQRRLRDIADGMLQLDEALAEDVRASARPAAGRFPRRTVVPVAIAVVLTGTLVSTFWALRRPATGPSVGVVRVPVTLAGFGVLPSPRTAIAISRDGRRLAYQGVDGGKPTQIYIRELDNPDVVPVRGTEAGINPFFSHDNASIGFTEDGARPHLYKVPVAGGVRTEIAQSPAPLRGLHWGADDLIVFGTTQGLFKVAASGGTPQRLTTSDPARAEIEHARPFLVPGTDLVLFTIVRPSYEDWELAAVSLSTRRVTLLGVTSATDAKYLVTGHLAYAAIDGAINVVPFDLRAVKVTGDPIPLVTDELVRTIAYFDVSETGSLIYVRDDGSARQRTLVWVDPAGNESPVGAPARKYSVPRLSPDESKIAIQITDRDDDIEVWDIERGFLRNVTREPGQDNNPVWTPDGNQIIYNALRAGSRQSIVRRINADGSGNFETLFTPSELTQLSTYAISRDGLSLILRVNQGLGLLSLASREPRTLVDDPRFFEVNATLSSDDRFLAYVSNEQGGPHVYVRRFENVDGKSVQISTPPGGVFPAFARNGHQVFYLKPPGVMMRVTLDTDPVLRPHPPEAVFDASAYLRTGTSRPFDVAKDGRFLMIKPLVPLDKSTLPEAQLVLNWIDDVKARVKTR